MSKKKSVLLIAGNGTLGAYVTEELLKMGCTVDILCRSPLTSDKEGLTYFQGAATYEFLCEFLKDRRYDGIANFLHYKGFDYFKKIHTLLNKKCKQVVFISSYRVYADLEHPIKESSPRLYDTVDDKDFLENEDYAVPKSQQENYLMKKCWFQKWTIVRPVISFSKKRLDLLMHSGLSVLNAAKAGTPIYLPESCKNHRAGLDWAGNSGKLIARLFFNPRAYHKVFTIYSGHDMTWGEVAAAYEKTTGVEIRYCSDEEYESRTPATQTTPWAWKYDRKFDRSIDPSRVLKATGLKKEDFATVEQGILHELELLGFKK